MVGFHAPFYWPVVKLATDIDDIKDDKPDHASESELLQDIDFQPEWEAEFVEADYRPQWILGVTSAGAVFFPSSFFYGFFKADTDRVAGGDTAWIAITWGPHMVCGVIMAAAFVLFVRNSAQRFCIRHYNALCAGLVIMIYMSTVWFNLVREIRRSKFQLASTPQVAWSIQLTGGFPLRSCHDSNPVLSISDWPFIGTAVGCNNLILSANVSCLYALVSLLPFALRMRAPAAAAVALCNALVLVLAVLATGSRPWLLLSLAAFQLAAGLSAAAFCRAREALARRQFLVADPRRLQRCGGGDRQERVEAGVEFLDTGQRLRNQFVVARHIRAAAESERRFLHTLMPDNVLSRLATHRGPDLLGATIPHCTVMFCMLEPQAPPPPRNSPQQQTATGYNNSCNKLQ